MPPSSPISREVVIQAVDLYGKAWCTQDVTLLPSLFSNDCIYVERAFDKKATFCGLDAITEYWKYQICGKQSNIQFRHIASEMIRDADRPNVAVVKWLAEFDNRREHRVGKQAKNDGGSSSSSSSDKTYKRVRFCQMAKLIFDDNDDDENGKKHHKICYLEEYAQPMTGPGNTWPGLTASDDELWRRIRMMDPTAVTATVTPSDDHQTVTTTATTIPTPVAVCNFCRAGFPSRTQLHRHLKTTEVVQVVREEDGGGGGGGGGSSSGGSSSGEPTFSCVPIKEEENEVIVFLWVSFSLGYVSNVNLEHTLRKALVSWWRDDDDGTVKDPTDSDDVLIQQQIDLDSLTWAVPPDWSSSAVVNVASVKMEQAFFEKKKKKKKNEKKASDVTSSLNNILKDDGIRIHTVEVVDRPCVQARREFEKYEAFIPWSLLLQQQQQQQQPQPQPQSHRDETTNDNNTGEQDDYEYVSTDSVPAIGWSRQDHHGETTSSTTRSSTSHPHHGRRRPLEETKAGAFVDRAMTKRLRDATRILRDGGRKDLGHFFDGPNANNEIKIRLRTSTMDEPWQRLCRISISMRQPRAGYVETILGLLIAYAARLSSNISSEEELLAAALEFTDTAAAVAVQSKGQSENDDVTHDHQHSSSAVSVSSPSSSCWSSFPTEFVCLLEPALARYERKAKVILCGSHVDISDEMRKSIDIMECTVLRHMEGKLGLLQKWVNATSKVTD